MFEKISHHEEIKNRILTNRTVLQVNNCNTVIEKLISQFNDILKYPK